MFEDVEQHATAMTGPQFGTSSDDIARFVRWAAYISARTDEIGRAAVLRDVIRVFAESAEFDRYATRAERVQLKSMLGEAEDHHADLLLSAAPADWLSDTG